MKDISGGGLLLSHSGVGHYSPSITNVLTSKPTGTHFLSPPLLHIFWQLSLKRARRARPAAPDRCEIQVTSRSFRLLLAASEAAQVSAHRLSRRLLMAS